MQIALTLYTIFIAPMELPEMSENAFSPLFPIQNWMHIMLDSVASITITLVLLHHAKPIELNAYTLRHRIGSVGMYWRYAYIILYNNSTSTVSSVVKSSVHKWKWV